MAFSLALHWRPCPHRACVIASVKLSLSSALRRGVAEFAFEGPANAALAFTSIALVFLPALHLHHCQHCAVIVVASVAPASSPSLPPLRAPCSGVCPLPSVAVRGFLAVSGVVNARPPFSVA